MKRAAPSPFWPTLRRAGGSAGRLAAMALLSLAAWTAAAGAFGDTRWQAWAEPDFQHITTAEGLPNENVLAVAEDGAGFIWVGTLGGLARWDGYRFRVFKFTPGATGGLPDNLIQVLHSDPAGRLWIGTSSAGLVRLEPTSERFTTFGAGADGLGHVSVRALADDGAGGLWVGTDSGLDRIDADSGRVTRVPLGLDAPAGLPGNRVLALLHDRRGRLWAGTPQGLFRRLPGQERFEAVPLPTAAGTAADAPPPQPERILEDSAGHIWVGTTRSGAYVLDGEGRQARAIDEPAPARDGRTLDSLRVVALVEARPGEVWLGALGQGVITVDTASGQVRRLARGRDASPMDHGVRGLYRDRAGLVWVATNTGLRRIDPRSSSLLTIREVEADTGRDTARVEVTSLLGAADDRVWMGTHGDGLRIVDPLGGPVRALRPDPARPDSALPPDVVASLSQARDGTVYIGTFRGLYRADADGGRLARVAWPGRPAGLGVGQLLQDGGHLWVGGLTDGLWALDLATGQARAALPHPAQQLTDARITALARGPAGELWIGTRNGLNRYHPASGEVLRLPVNGADDGLAAGLVSSLLVDRRGRLWIGTYGGGVNLLENSGGDGGVNGDGDGRSPRLQRIDGRRGLPDDNVNALAEDASGRIWVSTDNGLAVIDPGTLRVRALRRADGVVHQTYWTASVARTVADEIIFGAAGGVTVVRPERLQPWDYRPPVVATEVLVGGRPAPGGPLGGPVRVPADGNSLSVEFAALDYSAPQRNRYAYRLEGHDSGWTETDATRRVASYANLPPGDYRLLLRGSNRDGAFSEAVLALPVEVLPAWHQTLGARLLAVLAALALLAGVVHARTRALRTRRVELERLVDARTAELQRVSRALEEKSRVLELASISDPLTGLQNRRFLTERIDAALAATARRARAAGDETGHDTGHGAAATTDTIFLLIDVDHFKRVNDEFGHAAGDAVLVQLGQRLKVAMRDTDFVVRWGGEEFLAVARDTDRARADELSERIRTLVAETPFHLANGRQLHTTCSIGHACWPFLPQHPGALDWQGVVNLADIGLLTAKRLGRHAWVGLAGTEQARPEGLLSRAQGAPAQALAQGEIRLTSNRPLRAAAEALPGH